MAKRGPKGPSKPMSDIDLDRVVAMMRIHCTKDEISSVLGMSTRTLDRRLKEMGQENFDTLYKKNRAHGNASLRRMQWKQADGGNTAMQIWLGKQYLGQQDKQQLEHQGEIDTGNDDAFKTIIAALATARTRSS